jgi:hypothetical protein
MTEEQKQEIAQAFVLFEEKVDLVLPPGHVRNVIKMEKEKTHCRNGHAYTPENIYWWKRKRACRICKIASVKKYVEKRRLSA